MSSLAVIRDDRYLEHNAGPGHPESPDRLRVIHDLIAKEFPDLPLIPPRLATEDELALVHDPFYIDTVARTEGVAFSRLDADTGLSARSYETARLAVGGLLQGVDALFTPNAELGTLNSLFAFVRPPGHHAEPGRGMGFCLFNNIAIGARYLMEAHGARRILVVDWDVHHGNGTQWAFYDDSRVLFMSIHQYPFYPGTGAASDAGQGSGSGFTVNVPMRAGYGDAECLDAFELVFRPIAQRYAPEFVLVSAGFDAHHADPLGGLQVTEQGFADMASVVLDVARTSASGRCVLVLEGGYHLEALALSVESVVRRLCSAGSDKAEKSESRPYRRLSRIDFLSPILQVHSGFWGLSRAAD